MSLVTFTSTLVKFVDLALRNLPLATRASISSITDHTCEGPAVYACFFRSFRKVILATHARVRVLTGTDPLSWRRPRSSPSAICNRSLDSQVVPASNTPFLCYRKPILVNLVLPTVARLSSILSVSSPLSLSFRTASAVSSSVPLFLFANSKPWHLK